MYMHVLYMYIELLYDIVCKQTAVLACVCIENSSFTYTHMLSAKRQRACLLS